MKWVSEFQHPRHWRFVIKQDSKAGFYLYIYNKNGFNTHDYLQDTLEVAQEQAFEDFGVPLTSWKRIE